MLDANQLKERFNRAIEGIPSAAARVAEACNVTPQAVSQWKRTGRIDKKHFAALSDLTGKPLAYWLGEDDPAFGIAFSRRPVSIPAYQIRGVDDESADLVVMPVRGDSMLPRLADGDAVLINRADTRIVDGKVYALVLGREAKIKTLRRGADGSLIVMSENTDKRMYPDEVVGVDSIEDVYIIGRAVQRSGDL